MDIIQLLPQVYEKFFVFFLVMTRISTLLTTFVLFRRELITGRIIISLAFLLTFYVTLNYPNVQIVYDVFSVKMLVNLLIQVLIGFLSGLILNIIFEIFVGVGQIVSTQAGLGMASLIDPRFGYITSLTHFYMITTALVFLHLNGHLIAIKTIVESFHILPINYDSIPRNLIESIFKYAGIIFSGSVMLSISIVIVLLLTNIALAIMTKFAPQFNLFSIGINMQVVLGLFCVYITYYLFVGSGMNLMKECLSFYTLKVAGH